MTTNNTFAKVKSAIQSRGSLPVLGQALKNLMVALDDQKEEANNSELSQLILSDVALTKKVLESANSVMYRSIGGGSVTTISRAIVVLGQNYIKHMAVGLKLLDAASELSNEGSVEVKTEMAKILFGSTLARKVCETVSPAQTEEVAATVILSSMAKVIAAYYFPSDWASFQAKRDAVPPDELSEKKEADIALQCFGCTLPELTLQAMKAWSFPAALIERTQAISTVSLENAEIESNEDWIRCTAKMSYSAAEKLVEGDRMAMNRILVAGLKRVAPDDHAEAAFKLFQFVEEVKKDPEAMDGLARNLKPAKSQPLQGKPLNCVTLLKDGLNEVKAMSLAFSPKEVLSSAHEIIHRATGATSSVWFSLHPAKEFYQAQTVLGEKPSSAYEKVEVGYVPNIIHSTLRNRQPVHLADAKDSKLQSRIPRWIREQFQSSHSLSVVPVFDSGSFCLGFFLFFWDSRTEPLNTTETAALMDLVNTALVSLQPLAERPKSKESQVSIRPWFVG